MIVSLIHQARISARHFHWQRFLVPEENGNIVCIRQVKVHAHGTREVGSGFVLPADFHKEYRIGRMITSVIGILSKDKVRILQIKKD
jgi:hypothetical protein